MTVILYPYLLWHIENGLKYFRNYFESEHTTLNVGRHILQPNPFLKSSCGVSTLVDLCHLSFCNCKLGNFLLFSLLVLQMR